MSHVTLNEIITSTVEGLGYELWGVDFRPHADNGLLRIYIESENGILVEDCANVSRQLSSVFDVEDPIPGAYTLEVSSPGLDRMLYTPKQYESYKGWMVKIKTRVPLDGRRNFKGTIEALNEDSVILKIDQELYEVPFDSIERSRLKTESSGK
ncbi:MAG: ribosome maturation factor RimP [Thiotrichaceae bacterium]|nr:ribosome maturation factor RimP [Thiotrichaceae bacterium]